MVPYGTLWYHMVPHGTLWYHMVPYGTIQPPLTMICPPIHDKRRPLSATRLRKKRDAVCHLRGFNVSICFLIDFAGGVPQNA